MSNKITRYALIQAVDTTKYLQTVSIDVRMDFVETANNVEGYHAGVADKITNALSSLFNEQNITVTLMNEEQYSQMINNGQ
jgi:hypothetical protein